VARGKIESLMNYFAVSKGDTTVRVVYDGTLLGLNASLWAPYFPLPTIHLRFVKPGTYIADNDVGEWCFHNWILDERVRKWCNVKYAVGTNNSTVERLMVVMRERTTTLESEQQH